MGLPAKSRDDSTARRGPADAAVPPRRRRSAGHVLAESTEPADGATSSRAAKRTSKESSDGAARPSGAVLPPQAARPTRLRLVERGVVLPPVAAVSPEGAREPAELLELPPAALPRLGDSAVSADDPLWAAYFAAPSPHTRNPLVERYQDLVREIVRRFSTRLPRSVDRGDLLTAGSVGLISAIASFDPGRGVRFEAYGERRIKGALLDELRTQDWMPRPWRQRIEQHKRVLERLRGELGRSPRDGEVAAVLGVSLEDYQLLFGVGLPGAPTGGQVVSEDGEEGFESSLDVVADTRSDEPGEQLTRDELLALVAQKLTDQEYRIVYLKYWEELPMRQIGDLLGISESRVCKIHLRLIERLKDRLRQHVDRP